MLYTLSTLPFPWKQYLQQIDHSSQVFWQRSISQPDPFRLQHPDIWHSLHLIVGKVIGELVPQALPLTVSEVFLLHAAAYLYEMGWTTPYAQHLPVKRRYIESGCIIRSSTRSIGRGSVIDLDYLEPAMLNALACICSGPGHNDLSSLPMISTPIGLDETVYLPYLCALFQLADYLYIRRAKQLTMQNIPSTKSLDPLNARLLLQPYLPYIDIQRGGITAFFIIHPDDEFLAPKMIELFEEPLRRWWESNGSWLSEKFQFSFLLHTPRINIEHSGAAPEPLSRTCPAFIPFLKHFTPQARQTPLASKKSGDISQAPTPSQSEVQKIKAATTKERTKAFISYSREDRRYLNELHKHLKPYIREENIDAWDNTRLTAGDSWRDKLNKALNETKVAILLVSRDFLASDFIYNNELPPLLSAARRGGTTIISVIIGPCAFNASPLAEFHPMNSLDKPLNLMPRKGERDQVWSQVAELVKDLLTS